MARFGKLWSLLLVFFWMAGTGCQRTPATFQPPRFEGSLQSSTYGGERLDFPEGGWVGVEGLTFRDGAKLDVIVRDELPDPLSVYRPYLATPVVTLRFNKQDLYSELPPSAIERLLYGTVISFPVRRALSAERSNAIVVINNRHVLALPYGAVARAGSQTAVRIPLGTYLPILEEGENNVTVFLAEPPSTLPQPQASGDWAHLWLGKPQSGSVQFRSNEHTRVRQGQLSPVHVIFSSGLNVAAWASLNARNDFKAWSDTLYKRLKNSLGIGNKVDSLIRFYQFIHDGHHGFLDVGSQLSRKLDLTYQTLWDLGGEKGKVVVAGFSMGGLISRDFASHNPDKVLGVFTMDTPHEGSIIADMVAFRYNCGPFGITCDWVAWVADQITNRYGLRDAIRFTSEATYTTVVTLGPIGLTMAGVDDITSYPIFADKSAIKPLYYQPESQPYARICLARRQTLMTLTSPPTKRGVSDIARLRARESRTPGLSNINLYSAMVRGLPNPSSPPSLWHPTNRVLWGLGKLMGAAEYPTGSPCTSLYPPNQDWNYQNDGVVNLTSGLWSVRSRNYYTHHPSILGTYSGGRLFHLEAPDLTQSKVRTVWNQGEGPQYKQAMADLIATYLKQEWMKSAEFLFQIAWENDRGNLDLDLIFFPRAQDLDFGTIASNYPRTSYYLPAASNNTRPWRGLLPYMSSMNAGPEGIAIPRGQTSTLDQRIYVAARVYDGNFLYGSTNFTAKYRLTRKPNAGNLSNLWMTGGKSRKTSWSKGDRQYWWIIGYLTPGGAQGLTFHKIDRWVGETTVDTTIDSCTYTVRVIDYTDAQGMPVIRNYPMISSGVDAILKNCQ